MVAVLFVVLFSIHALPTIFAIAVFMAVIVYHNRHSLLRIIGESLLLIPVMIIMVIWWTGREEEESTLKFLIQYYSRDYFTSIYKRGGLFVTDNFSLFEGAPGFIVAALLFVGIGIFLFIWLRSRVGNLKKGLLNEIPINAWIYFLVGLGIFLFAPNRLPEQQYLYQRFAVFVCLALIIIVSILFANNFNRKYLTVICVTFLAHLVLYTDYFMDFQRENTFFTKEIVPVYSTNSKLAALLAEDMYGGHHQYQHYANYHIVWIMILYGTKELR